MFLKKVIKDGKVSYEEITYEEAKELRKRKEEIISTSEDDLDDLDEEIEEELEKIEELLDEDDNDDDDDLDDDDDAEKHNNYKNIFNFNNHSIYGALPFLSKADIHELIKSIIKKDEAVKNLKIEVVLPFASREDCDALFIKALDLNLDIKISHIVPFVSKSCLSKFVDKYIEGKYSDVNVNLLYPFLDSNDIKRLFYYVMRKKEK